MKKRPSKTYLTPARPFPQQEKDFLRCWNCKKIGSLRGMKLSDLIDYLIDEPLPNHDDQRTSLYPFIACEMLTDSPDVQDLFFADHIYLDQLFSFLQKDYLNATAAAYCAAVAGNLLERNEEALVGYLFVKYDYGLDLVRHIGTRAVHDFLSKLIHCEPGLSHFSLDKLYLLESLSLFIANDSADEEVLNAASLVTEVICHSKEMKGWRVYIALLMQEKLAAAWCRSLLSPREVLSVAAIRLVTCLLSLSEYDSISRINYEDIDRAIKKQLGKSYSPPPSTITISSVPPLLSHLLPILPTLIDILRPACSPTYKGRLGQKRTAIVELITALSKSSIYEVTEALVDSTAIPVVVSLFQAQPWASFLHTAFERLVGQLVNGGNLTLRRELILEGRLPLVMAEIARQPYEEKTGRKGKVRKGYMGHVTRISNFLLANDLVQDLLEPFLLDPDWTDFLSSFLAPQTVLEELKLGESESFLAIDPPPPFQEVTNTLAARPSMKMGGKISEKIRIPEVSGPPATESNEDPLVEFSPALSFQPATYWRLPPQSIPLDLPPLG